jgi:hypothetical protein
MDGSMKMPTMAPLSLLTYNKYMSRLDGRDKVLRLVQTLRDLLFIPFSMVVIQQRIQRRSLQNSIKQLNFIAKHLNWVLHLMNMRSLWKHYPQDWR